MQHCLLPLILQVLEVQRRGNEDGQTVGVGGIAWGQEDVGEVEELCQQDGGHDGDVFLCRTHSLHQNLQKWRYRGVICGIVFCFFEEGGGGIV